LTFFIAVELRDSDDEDDGSNNPVPLPKDPLGGPGDPRPPIPSLAASIAPPMAPAAVASSPTAFLFTGPPFFSPKLSTDFIVIKDGFVLLPKLACRTRAG
jgi:hypothetical protein